jgi:tetratricopeptide (TPR) repeat protein
MNHPHLSALHRLYLSETQPFRKVHRMIDLFESLLKMHTVVILSEYVQYNRLSEAAKGLLAQGLRTPSLGTWQLFSRVLFDELDKEDYLWLAASFAADFRTLDKALNQEKTNVISFRNGYAHGATPTDDSCTTDIRRFEPFLEKLLQTPWLRDTATEVRNGKVFLTASGGDLSLHPVLLYRPEALGPSLAYFNDLKNERVGLLNYPLGKHYREKNFYFEFLEHLPLHEWRKSGNSEFNQRIEELTETFKGRTRERSALRSFVQQHHKGYFSVQGNPGIGKSALVAQFFKDLRADIGLRQVQVVEYFIRRGTQQAQAEYMLGYLIRRTDELFPAGREVRAEGQSALDLQSQLFAKWRQWGDQASGQRLLILIDGLDEGVENRLVDYLPRENFNNILFIYGSRPGGHRSIDELWTQLPVEHHVRLELEGLGLDDIRALIYEVANKYEVPRESPWVEAVQSRSKGNPLYLKLLCDALEQGSIRLNDIRALPDKIDEYYRAILNRYANDPDGDALLAGLYTFAAAKDYLTLTHIGLINRLGSATLHRIGSTLKEVLYKSPQTEDVLDYQLFHESFREYLEREKRYEIFDASRRIIAFCTEWPKHSDSWEQRYTLEHYADHLADGESREDTDTLLQLIYDKAYLSEQKRVLKGFSASRGMFRLAMVKAAGVGRDVEMLEAALCLVDLWYEEANDAASIIALVTGGDIDLALQRIESFGGSDEEGLRRKCTLYLLCLLELTLLSGKDKPFRSAAIGKLLKHFDEQLPIDHSILKWKDFFPSYLVFRMACAWAEMGLDYMIVNRRTDVWNSEWLADQGPYSDIQFELMMTYANGISDGYLKIRELQAISSELAKQGILNEASTLMEDAISCAKDIQDEYWRSIALHEISIVLGKQGRIQEASTLMEDIFSCIRNIRDEYRRSVALYEASIDLAKQGRIEDASTLIEEALSCAMGIHEDYNKSQALMLISTEMVNYGKTQEASSVLDEAILCARNISNDYKTCRLLSLISTELWKHGKIEEASSVIKEAIFLTRGIIHIFDKCQLLQEISSELAKQGRIEEASTVIEEALSCAQDISYEYDKSRALQSISSELLKQEKIEQSLSCSRSIFHEDIKSTSLCAISAKLAKRQKMDEASSLIQEAISYTRGINNEFRKNRALRTIYFKLSEQGDIENASSVIEESLSCARGISNDYKKSRLLRDLSTELSKHGRIREALSLIEAALSYARSIRSEDHRIHALQDISSELVKQGRMEKASSVSEEARNCAMATSDKGNNGRLLQYLSCELTKQGKIEVALSCARCINDDSLKCLALSVISTEMAKQGKQEDASSVIEEAITRARFICDEHDKSHALQAISFELWKQAKIEEASSVMEEALSCARGSINDYRKSKSIRVISTEMSKQGMTEEALSCAREILDGLDKSHALAAISTKLSHLGSAEEASSVIEEAISCARGISDEYEKSHALKGIASELVKQEDWPLAEQTGLEISHLDDRHSFWKEIAMLRMAKVSWKIALEERKKLNSEEAIAYYLKGWVNSMKSVDANAECILVALPALVNDTLGMEALLQKYALNLIIIDQAGKNQIQRLNRTLNIQWALDIVGTFPCDERFQRQSTNLNEWLHEIPDEDDREQIALWARQVTKGKLTEEDFLDQLKKLV